ncbi:hypothetical protein RchiOBHm_Chr7g0229911 [Rosa chinensis]|uniref:Uncharacterized protein n=1 Tax=Rosa chinensis TaxID=74649 RepID=A0A2P6PFB5_ROSCH|nr:hypothetical protein RchiOBHm_Chr7g0229911 [Rosa chinensis]
MDFGRTSLKLVVFLVCLFILSISTSSTCVTGINFPTPPCSLLTSNVKCVTTLPEILLSLSFVVPKNKIGLY